MILFLPFNTFWHEFRCVWHLKITIIVVVQLPSRCLTLWTAWTIARQASLSLTISQSLPKFMSFDSVMASNHLILCHPLLLPSIFPSIRVISNESALRIRWSKVLEPQLQHQSFQWIFKVDFLEDWLVWSPCYPRDSLQHCNSSALSLPYGPTLTSIHDYWKNHSFDSMDLCRLSDVSAF